MSDIIKIIIVVVAVVFLYLLITDFIKAIFLAIIIICICIVVKDMPNLFGFLGANARSYNEVLGKKIAVIDSNFANESNNEGTSSDEGATNQTATENEEAKEDYSIPKKEKQETILAIEGSFEPMHELLFAGNYVLLSRDVSVWKYKGVMNGLATDSNKHDALDRLKANNYSNEEDWKKDFLLLYELKSQYVEYALCKLSYGFPKFSFNLSDDGKTVYLNFKNPEEVFNIHSEIESTDTDYYSNVKDTFSNKILKFINRDQASINMNAQSSDFRGSGSFKLVDICNEFAKEAFYPQKREALLSFCANCEAYPDSVINVDLNGIRIKENGVAKTNFSDEELYEIYGETEDTFKFEEKIGSYGNDEYQTVNMALFYSENDKCYEKIPFTQATEYGDDAIEAYREWHEENVKRREAEN